MAPPVSTAQKVTDLRIQRALAKPGAIGMKGFLLWTEAAWPKAITGPILKAANKYTPGAGPPMTLASPVNQGFGHYGRRGRMGFLGDDTSLVDVSFDPSSVDVSDSVTQAISDATQAPVSGTTAATSSQPASTSWLSDIGTAISSATQAALAVTQVKDAQAIFQTNLTRAQQGLAPIPTNPTAYGLPAPTANIGLAPQTQSMVIWIAAGLGALVLVSSLLKK